MRSASRLFARFLGSDRAVLVVVFLALAAPHLAALPRGGLRVISGDEPHYLLQITNLYERGAFDLARAYAEVHRGGAGAGERHAGTALAHHTVWFAGGERREWLKIFGDPLTFTRTADRGMAFIPLPGQDAGGVHPEYPTHPVGLTLVLAPLLYPLRGSAALEPAALLCSLLATFAAVLLFRSLARVFTEDRTRVNLVTVAAFLGTPAWPYATTLFNEPYLLLCTVGALALVLRHGRAFSAGGLIAWAILMKPTSALLLVPLLAGLLSERRLGRSLALMVLPAAAVASTLALNTRFFGAPLRAAQAWEGGDPIAGLLGLVFSPEHGLLLTAPILLVASAGWPALVRARPGPAAQVAATAALQIGLIALWWCWWSGYCYGPRLVEPILPLLVLPLCALRAPERPTWARRVVPAVVLGLLAVSVAINVLPAFFPGRMWSRHPFVAVAEKLAGVK